ncbi:MAG: hypothetical protein K2X78_02355 [Burkholderiaceae bacterium]|nr:hypothetical protein [Burkholderiaceae bacterium]
MSVTSRAAVRRHELLSDLFVTAERWLLEQDLAPEAASVTASGLVDHIVNHWGGQVISIPKDVRYMLTMRELEIYDQHTGDNTAELARKYHMSLRGMNKLLNRIRSKIKAAREADAAPGQLDMLEPPEPL